MERRRDGDERDLALGRLHDSRLRRVLKVLADAGERHVNPLQRLHGQEERVGAEVERVVVRAAAAVEAEGQEVGEHGRIHRTPRSAAPGRRTARPVVHDGLEVDEPGVTAADPLRQRLVGLVILGKSLHHERVAAGRDGQRRREKR